MAVRNGSAEVRGRYCSNPHHGRFRRRWRECREATRDHRPMADPDRMAPCCSRCSSSSGPWASWPPSPSPASPSSPWRSRRRPSRPSSEGRSRSSSPRASLAGMTTMALAGVELHRLALQPHRARAGADPRDRRADPAARGRHSRRAAPGSRLQRRQRRLPPGRGARHPRPAHRHPEPRDPARHPRRRGRAGGPPLQAAQRRLHRHRPLQADQRHLRPQLRRRGAAPDRRASLPMAVRVSDTFGRYGGEEFMLILPETIPEDAVRLAEELRALVQNEPLRIAGDQTVKATISIGDRRRPRLRAPARHAGRPRRRGDVRGQVARPQPHLPLPRARRREHPCGARRSRPSAPRPGNRHRPVGQRHGDPGAGIGPGAAADITAAGRRT